MATNLNVTGILTVDSDATIKGSMKLDSLTSSSILILDTNKNVTVSNVTSTELGYLKGVTSSIQTQLNNKPGEIVVTGTSKGEIFNDYTYNVASANYAHAEGSGARASGGCSHAEGEATNASGYASHAEGQGTRATGGYSHTEGNNTAASGNASHAEGFGTKASSTSQHVQGKYNVEDTDGIYAHIVGWGSNDLNRKNIHTIDTSGNAMFTGKITVGDGETIPEPTADGDLITKKYFDDNSSSGGVGKDTNGMSWNEDDESYTGVAGAEIFNDYTNNIASGLYSHAEGQGTIASGNRSHTEGQTTIASGRYTHAEGFHTTASGDYSHTEGFHTIASGDYSHAECCATASGECSHAEGSFTTASGACAHSEGDSTLASSECQHVQGKYNVEDTEVKYVHIVGWGTNNNNRKNIHTIDTSGNAMFTGKVTVGDGTIIPEPTADGDLITKKYFDDNSSSGGVGKDTNGMSWNEDDESYTGMAGAEIFNNYEYNIASGDYSHAEGDDTTASGPSSHAEGYGTIASANSSHAEGYGTIASGDCSHAEGEFAEASGISAHAEGNSTASGKASHAEGNSNAYGEESHAEGYYADAIGNYSHAEGYNTIASSECQHVQGKYNVEDTEGKYVHIVGWGTSNESKNIHTIDTFGNAMFTGKITVGDGETIPEPTADGDLITKKYFDDNSNNSGNTEYVTPESFGAVGDGVTDDVNAFTQAAATGKPILLTQRYYTSTSITITSSVYSYTNAEIINDAIITFAQNNIIISGITFNGNNSSPYVHCISDNVYFYKCQFKNFSGNENYKLTETLRLGEYNTVTHTGVIVDSCIFNGASSNYENDVEGDNDGVVRQIYIQNCSAKIVNCEFKNCVGMEDGDIIHVQSKSALDSTYPYSKKGGISFPSVPCIISGCIFHLGKCKSAVKVQCSDVIIQNNTVLVEDEATIDDARYVFRAMNCNNVNISSNTVNIEDTTELKLVSIFSIEGMENVILQNNLIYDRSTGISSLYDNSTSVTVILSRFVQTSIFNNNSILLRSIHNLMDIEYSSLTISDNKIECVGDYQDTIFYINKYYNHSTDGSDIPEDVVLRFIHNELIVSGTRNKIQTDTSYAGSVEFSNNKIIGNVSAYDFRFDANAPTTFCRVSDIDLQLKFTTVTGNYLTTLKDIHIERCTLIYADIKKAEVCLIKDCDISSTYQAIYFTNVGEVEVDGNYIHNITNRVFRVMTGNPSINMKNNSFDTGNYSQLVESHYNNDEFLRSNIIWYKNNQGIINGINNGSEPDSTMSYELGCLFFKESENKFVFSNGNGSWV